MIVWHILKNTLDIIDIINHQPTQFLNTAHVCLPDGKYPIVEPARNQQWNG